MERRHRHNVYIWQHADWPNFRWDANKMLEQIGRLSQKLGTLNGRMSMLGFNDKNNTMLNTMSDELISSSEIEGILLNAHSVRSSIARKLGIEEHASHPKDHYVEGLVDVMLDALGNYCAPLTMERFFGWHGALFPTGRSGMHRITVADLRKGEEPMQVVSGAMGHERVHYEAPPSNNIAEEMSRLIDWCNTTAISPFLMAGIAHLWFLTIHPFDDGNGRIGRTLTDILLARLDDNGHYYSMSVEINKNKKEYYSILEKTQKGNLDITEWLLWFFNCIEKAINRATETIERTIQKAKFWEQFRETPVNDRQQKILNRLWDGFEGKLTTSKWAKICGCSQDTALRDINDLIVKGMLQKSAEGGRSANYLLAIS